MTSKRYNQFIQHIMRENQPDKEKLISLATLMRQNYHLTVQREAVLMFEKDTGRLANFAGWITEEQFKKYTIHVPDLLFFAKGTMWILEIDGYIHYVKTFVKRKDVLRDECYDRAGLHWKKFDEVEILEKSGVKKLRGAKVTEIWPYVSEFIESII